MECFDVNAKQEVYLKVKEHFKAKTTMFRKVGLAQKAPSPLFLRHCVPYPVQTIASRKRIAYCLKIRFFDQSLEICRSATKFASWPWGWRLWPGRSRSRRRRKVLPRCLPLTSVWRKSFPMPTPTTSVRASLWETSKAVERENERLGSCFFAAFFLWRVWGRFLRRLRPNSVVSLLKERIRCHLRRLENRLLVCRCVSKSSYSSILVCMEFPVKLTKVFINESYFRYFLKLTLKKLSELLCESRDEF